MTRTSQRGMGALIAALLAVLLSLSMTGVAHAGGTPETRDDYELGRFRDLSEWGDFSSPLTQSLAVLALHRADETSPSPEAVDLLLNNQCADGGFPGIFLAPSTADAPACTSSVDTTVFVTQALYAVGEDDAVADAVGWLLDTQAGDGSFRSQDGFNTNSTGLAAIALELGGELEAAEEARAWVADLQDGCETETPGAIPFSSESRESVRLATTQAITGLAGTSLATIDGSAVSDDVPVTGCDDDGTELGNPAEAGAAYLITTLADDGDRFQDEWEGDLLDAPGATIDMLFALASVEMGRDTLQDITAWLTGAAGSYTRGGDDVYAGATAKLALAMVVVGSNPRDVGGINLIDQLEGREVTAAGSVAVSCDSETVSAGDEAGCTITGLLPAETVDVLAQVNPILFDGPVTADETGTATFDLTVPEGLSDGDTISITIDGFGAPLLAELGLTVTVTEAEDTEEEPLPVETGEPETVEDPDDESATGAAEEAAETLPETGSAVPGLLGGAAAALLLGALLLTRSRTNPHGRKFTA